MSNSFKSFFAPLGNDIIVTQAQCRVQLLTGSIFLIDEAGNKHPLHLGQIVPLGAHVVIESGTISFAFPEHSIISLMTTDQVSVSHDNRDSEGSFSDQTTGETSTDSSSVQSDNPFSIEGLMGRLTKVSSKLLVLEHSEESIIASHREGDAFFHETFHTPPHSSDISDLHNTSTSMNHQHVSKISITMSGLQIIPPQAATISGQDSGGVVEDARLHTQGALSVSDPNPGQAHFVQDSQTGMFGTFSMKGNGQWAFDVDNSNPAVQGLGVGDALTSVFIVHSVDGTSHKIVININGTDDIPILQAQSQSVAEDGSLLSGHLLATDVDVGDHLTFSASSKVDGFILKQDGSYAFDPAHSAYQHLAVGQTQTLTIPVTVTDTVGATASQKLVITVVGTNDTPVLHAQSQSVVEDGSILTGQMVATDVDTGDTQLFTAINLPPGFTLGTDGKYTFDSTEQAYQHLAAGQIEVVQIPVTVTDSAGATSTQNLEITVTGSNDAPTITGSVVLTQGSEDANYTLHISDLLSNATDTDTPDQGHLTVHNLQAVKPDGTSAGTLSDNQDGTFTFNPDANYNGAVEFKYEVQDPQGASTPATTNLNLQAVRDVATFSGDDTGAIKEDVNINTHISTPRLIVSGFLSVHDPDAGEDHFQYSPFGEHAVHDPFSGHLQISNAGSWSYTVDDNNTAIQQLSEGQTEVVTYRVRSADGTTHDINVTVTGTNDAPVLQAQSQSVREDGSLLTGQMIASDVDSGDTLSFTTSNYPPGFTLNKDGSYSFDPTDHAYQHLAVGQPEKITIPITVTDSEGASETKNLELTIHGTNDASIVSGATILAPGMEDTSVTLHMADLLTHATDTDATDVLSVTSLKADHGAIIDNKDGTFSFVPEKNYNGQVNLTYDVTDGHGGSTPAQATMSLTPVGDAATIGGVDTGDVTEDRNTYSLVSFLAHQIHTYGHLTITDPDTGENHFDFKTFVHVSNHSELEPYTSALGGRLDINKNGTWEYIVDTRKPEIQHLGDGETLKDSVKIQSPDGTEHTIEITIHGTNDAPTVAGVTLLSGEIEDTAVTLHASDLLSHATDADTTDSLSVSNLHSDHGTIVDNKDGTFTLAPEKDYSGKLNLTYDVVDGHGGSTPATAQIDVASVTDPASISVSMSAEQEVISTGSVDGHIIVRDINAGQPLNELTLEFTVIGKATGTSGGTSGPVILNFGDSNHNNLLSLWNPANMKVGGAGDQATGINLEDGNSHRVALTWESSTGDLKIFDNGNLVSTIHDFHKGETLPQDAYMVLGQKLNNPSDLANPGWNSGEHYQGEIFNAALAHHALTESEVAKAPVASQIDSSSGLILDVRSVGGSLVDTTGTHSLTDEGDLGHIVTQVNTTLTPPPPGSLLHLDVSITAPVDTKDAITGTTIGGFPTGTILTDGTHSATVGNNPVDVDGWDLDHLTAQLHGGGSNFMVSVTAETTGPDGQTADFSTDLPINMDLGQPLAVAVAHDEPLSDDEQDAIDNAFLAQAAEHADGQTTHHPIDSPINVADLNHDPVEHHAGPQKPLVGELDHDTDADQPEEAEAHPLVLSDILQTSGEVDALLASQPAKSPVAAPIAQDDGHTNDATTTQSPENPESATPDVSILEASLIDNQDDENV